MCHHFSPVPALQAGRELLLTNLQYLKAPAAVRTPRGQAWAHSTLSGPVRALPPSPQKTKLTHGGAAAIIIAVCLFPFMCICLIWAYLYAKRTSGDVAAQAKSVEAEAAAAVDEPAPAASA